MKKYDLIISIGAACSCSGILRTCNLQYYSYPFDWVYGSDFLGRIKILTSDFDNWFNKEDLEFVEFENKKENKDTYKNTKTNIHYNHDFSRGIPFDITYKEIKEKYDRRINRLLNQISKSKKILLVWLENPDNNAIIENEILIKGLNLLKQKFKKQQIDILYIRNINNIDFENKIEQQINKNITTVAFDYNKYNKDYAYLIKAKDLVTLFKNNYRLSFKNLTFKNIKENIISKIKTYITCLQIKISTL